MFFYVAQRKVSHTGLERNQDDKMFLSGSNIPFIVHPGSNGMIEDFISLFDWLLLNLRAWFIS